MECDQTVLPSSLAIAWRGFCNGVKVPDGSAIILKQANAQEESQAQVAMKGSYKVWKFGTILPVHNANSMHNLLLCCVLHSAPKAKSPQRAASFYGWSKPAAPATSTTHTHTAFLHPCEPSATMMRGGGSNSLQSPVTSG